jgi:hypothetical protein
VRLGESGRCGAVGGASVGACWLTWFGADRAVAGGEQCWKERKKQAGLAGEVSGQKEGAWKATNGAGRTKGVRPRGGAVAPLLRGIRGARIARARGRGRSSARRTDAHMGRPLARRGSAVSNPLWRDGLPAAAAAVAIATPATRGAPGPRRRRRVVMLW